MIDFIYPAYLSYDIPSGKLTSTLNITFLLYSGS